jgi:hypothetical protein
LKWNAAEASLSRAFRIVCVEGAVVQDDLIVSRVKMLEPDSALHSYW